MTSGPVSRRGLLRVALAAGVAAPALGLAGCSWVSDWFGDDEAGHLPTAAGGLMRELIRTAQLGFGMVGSIGPVGASELPPQLGPSFALLRDRPGFSEPTNSVWYTRVPDEIAAEHTVDALLHIIGAWGTDGDGNLISYTVQRWGETDVVVPTVFQLGLNWMAIKLLEGLAPGPADFAEVGQQLGVSTVDRTQGDSDVLVNLTVWRAPTINGRFANVEWAPNLDYTADCRLTLSYGRDGYPPDIDVEDVPVRTDQVWQP